MTSLANQKTTRRTRPRRFHINLPLWLGLLLVGSIAFLAIRGPSLAPRDPLEENLIVKDETTGDWHVPPFSAFTVNGFPLGSDEFGRDLFSRLLFAVRPTLQMVLLVATVRLFLGTLIGVVAGYSGGRIGRFFDSLISSALALPGLLVALGAIAVVGVELGVIAFVIGLSITGWAETARLVREQTRSIRSEVYVEAAHALGAADTQIVFGHVLRQIRAMLLMLFAFEVGSTLMLTAGLGFLGYYIGGDVWVDVDDFVARRTSGEPELGQMLATAWVRLTDPWGLVSVGSVVFSSVLGFNLIGEGLRLRINPEVQVRRIRWLSDAWASLRLNLAQAWYPVGHLLFGSRLAVSLWMLAIGIGLGFGAITGWQQGLFRLPETDSSLFFAEQESAITPTPAGSSTTVDAAGTSEGQNAGSQTISGEPIDGTPTAGDINAFELPTERVPLNDPVVAWTLTDETGFAGSPAVDANGDIYVAALGGQVYALGADGTEHWTVTLSPQPAFSPSLGMDGNLFLPDQTGGVFALGPDGAVRWQFTQPEDGLTAVSQIVIGPDGALYYSVSRGTVGFIQALAPDGTPRWLAETATPNFFQPPNLDAAGELVFVAGDIFNAASGERLALESVVEPQVFFVGADGKNYLLSDNTVFEWQRSGETIELLATIPAAAVPSQVAGNTITPLQVFVLQDGSQVFFYRGSVVWQNALGELDHTALAPNLHDLSIALSLEDDRSLIACGTFRYSQQDPLQEVCAGFNETDDTPPWRIVFGDSPGVNDSLAGGARTPTGFVLASSTGSIYGVMNRDIADALAAWQAQVRTQAELEGTTITATGSGWIFTAPARLLVRPFVHANGSTYLLTVENKFYVLSPEGVVEHVLPLPEPVFELEQTFFGGGTGSTPFPPILAPDGAIVVASNSRLYSIGLDGTIVWEFPLDAVPHSPPIADPDGETYFQLDTEGTLYAFSPTNGLLWKHDLEEGLRPAFAFPVFGPDGSVFYSITNGTRGQIEALSAEGDPLWRTTLTTFNFYRPIQITPNGDWISLDDNVVRTETGELVELADTEFRIDQFVMGLDGKTYLLSGGTLMEWSLIAGGRLSINRQVTIAVPPNATSGYPPSITVTENDVAWFRFFGIGGSHVIYMWVDFDGTVNNIITVNLRDDFILQEDFSDIGLTVCGLERDESRVICLGYQKGLQDPAWDVTIMGIQRAYNIQYSDGVLFIQTDNDTVQTVNVTLP